MKKIILAAVATALVAPAGAALAQQGPPDPAALVARMDTNKDGAISKEEAAGSRLADRFDAIDANKDGKVTAEELAAAFAAMRQQQGGQ